MLVILTASVFYSSGKKFLLPKNSLKFRSVLENKKCQECVDTIQLQKNKKKRNVQTNPTCLTFSLGNLAECTPTTTNPSEGDRKTHDGGYDETLSGRHILCACDRHTSLCESKLGDPFLD